MILNTLEKLISFKTTPNNLKDKKRAALWIFRSLKSFPLNIKFFEFSGQPSVVALSKKSFPKVFLAAHLDVVPAPEDMFNFKIKDRKAFGRGVFDMKFAIACYLKLIKELKDKLSNMNFGIMITSDEETGGFFGTKKLIEKGFKSEVVFLPDGGYNWKMERGAKGAWILNIKCFAKSAHGSRPWQSWGANERLIESLYEFKKFFQSEPCKIENHWHSTLNIGKISGGEAANQVSNFSQAFLDIRFLNEKEKREIQRYLNSLKKKFNLRVQELILANPYQIDKKNRYVKIFLNILEQELGKKPEFSFSHGSSDARFFFARKIPVISITPRGGGHHSEKEWIDIEDLERYYSVLKRFILEVS
jgi:succinyl-diaminopimelate desuccinylase